MWKNSRSLRYKTYSIKSTFPFQNIILFSFHFKILGGVGLSFIEDYFSITVLDRWNYTSCCWYIIWNRYSVFWKEFLPLNPQTVQCCYPHCDRQLAFTALQAICLILPLLLNMSTVDRWDTVMYLRSVVSSKSMYFIYGELTHSLPHTAYPIRPHQPVPCHVPHMRCSHSDIFSHCASPAVRN